MLTPTQKGNIAEAAIAAHATKLHIPVLRPLCEGLRYDLAFDTGDRLWRVQCKWAALVEGVVRIQTPTNRHSPVHGYIITSYTADEIDLIAAYCPDLEKVYVVPIAQAAGRRMLYLRHAPARNNQAMLVNWARDYELGAIAQLGERSAGSRKAEGSSPSSSTPPKAA